MLRLPWEAWGETDVMLGMAADLHDRLVCSCGCGQWEADAHDPDKKDRVVVEASTCYVRRAIEDYVEKFEPPKDTVLSVRFVTDRHDADRAAYEEIVARFPGRFGRSAAPSEPDAEGDAGGDDRDGDPEQ